MAKNSLGYKDAGVDIDAGNQLVERIKPLVKNTHRLGVLDNIGGFGALFELDLVKYKKPILVSGTDGVGTKLKLAIDMQKHQTIGIDLVAMCVNDLIVQGAEPLFFLDYYATGKLELDVATEVIKGITDGCKLSGAALIGGETAEMPGMYGKSDYDLAGFCVGIVEKDKIITGDKVQAGDRLIALASSGPHSNGYSLIRKIIEVNNTSLEDAFNNSTIGETLLTPTKIYVKSILSLLEGFELKAISHITGGGLLENIPRVIPDNSQVKINQSSWDLPDIFKWLQSNGKVTDTEMLRTFNCGIGLVLVVSADTADAVIAKLKTLGEQAWDLGSIVDYKDKTQTQVTFE